ncbi:MAG: RNB domain-containing ribonuclease [Candidatus Marinimicrobia bacterium]|nr:RNB domain-containing ribonuclease [Candidatus Neomarinimicrobiota bacterium]
MKFQQTLENVLKQNDSPYVKRTALRAMMKAKYSIEPLGHFGLSFKDYTHFTSPIRRYPDLMVHRLLKKYLNQQKPDPDLKKKLKRIANISSDAELRGMEAERQYHIIKQMRYFKKYVGDIYQGFVSDVKSYGLWVEIDNSYIEGFVPIQGLKKDRWVFDEVNKTLTGHNTNTKYTPGDKVTVRLVRVDIDRCQAEFYIEEEI